MIKFFAKAISPIRYFFNDSRAVGVLLITATIISLLFSNLFIGDDYSNFFRQPISLHTSFLLPAAPINWINDFLMAFFFLLAGMEIKRELLVGELSNFKKAILPFGAAIGGMFVPATIFVACNISSSYLNGWGIPTATDIAFSLGVCSLFGKRVPVGLKILLMALAIIDDLGAILVIAFFYGGAIQIKYLLISAGFYAILWASNLLKLKYGFVQILLSFCLWYSIFLSGVEAGITGVLIALVIPKDFLSVIERFIHAPVNFLILPLFALANTATQILSNIVASFQSPISMGIILGLTLGKPLGIFMFCRILVAFKIASLPRNINWSQIMGMGTLAGIGFTMSIFTTSIAYNNEEFRNIAKIAILTSMVISVILSGVYFSFLYTKNLKIVEFRKKHLSNIDFGINYA